MGKFFNSKSYSPRAHRLRQIHFLINQPQKMSVRLLDAGQLHDLSAAVSECDSTPALPRLDRYPNQSKVQGPALTVSYS